MWPLNSESMKQSVFISRHLPPGSFFYKILIANNLDVCGHSLISFSPVPFEVPETSDWLFFYSQHGVRFFYENLPGGVLPPAKIAAIGPATAEAVRGGGHAVHFVGDGDPETTAEAFLKMAAGQRVLFPQAVNSRRSIQKILGKKITGLDLVVYQNLPKENLDLPDFDVLVFTSPLNAQAYFSAKKRKSGQRVIAIGKTTAGALWKMGVHEVEVADEASEAGLAAAVLASLK